MRFLGGFITALLVLAVLAILVTVTGAYNVAASAPDWPLQASFLHIVMTNSVRLRAGVSSRESFSEEEARAGFKDYDHMCVICHSAPGKQRGDISKGMRPQPPKLADDARHWTNAQLFWIIKNGVDMTGMPAFGATHSDAQVWNLVAFLRRLQHMSADDFTEAERTWK